MSDVVSLPARLDMPAATRLLADLCSIDGAITVDGHAVTHLGALGLQTLVAAARAAIARGDSFTLSDPSDQMIEQMRIMGLSPEQLAEGKI